MLAPDAWIVVRGARTHNLRNVTVRLPRGRLSVLTGPSGCGKSSLAFDTIFAEGRRRYLETLRGDARALFDQLQRPDVDAVEGLPPVLAVSQHSGPPRPRSTLATITEIHDHLRLLYARLGTPHCTRCGQPLHKHSLAEIVRHTLARGEGRKIFVLAPLVQDGMGDHKEAFQTIRQGGFLRARIDGVMNEIRDQVRLDPRQPHTVEVVIDRLVVRPNMEERLTESLHTALRHGHGHVLITDHDEGEWNDRAFSVALSCPRCRITFPELTPQRFNFNNPQGACPRCTGFGQVWEIDPKLVLPDRRSTLKQVRARLEEQLEGCDVSWQLPPDVAALDVGVPLTDWPDAAFAQLQGALVDSLRALGETRAEEEQVRDALESLAGFVPCPECQGARLNQEARAVHFAGMPLHQVTAMSVGQALGWIERLAEADRSNDSMGLAKVRAVVLREISQRLRFLQEVGLDYLTLDRPAPTLSGGELQRARLATHLGGGLLGVCYILDEPTIGLHPRDTDRLLAALLELRDRGNTLIVVEHDDAVMRRADWLIDIGPGAGKQGGNILASGTLAEVLANPDSVTAPYLQQLPPPLPSMERKATAALPLPPPGGEGRGEGGPESSTLPLPPPGGEGRGEGGAAVPPSPPPTPHLVIHGARAHNLKNFTVAIPLGKLVCLTGVSGSGKSTLARDILCHAARRHLGLLAPAPGAHDRIDGLQQLDNVLEVDQKPLGRSPRSNPATYTGIYDDIRRVFAATRLAKARGYKANRFSFNVRGGRCEECQGQGCRRIALQFLPDLTVPCPVCQGRRFNAATLQIRYKDRSIADVLDMPIAEAHEFFANIPNIRRVLDALVAIGLGYLALGQPSNTLSGGEAQRVKLAAQLGKTASGRTLFLLDEPTTGLHFGDVDRLIGVLRQLVNAGNTLVVIEHHLGLIRQADWIIDLGPEGGAAGGQVVAIGPPAAIARCESSITGQFLRGLT